MKSLMEQGVVVWSEDEEITVKRKEHIDYFNAKRTASSSVQLDFNFI